MSTQKSGYHYPENATPTPFWGPMFGLGVILLAVALAIYGCATGKGMPKSENNEKPIPTTTEK